MTSTFSLGEKTQLDEQIDKIVAYLFGFQPPANRAMPTIDWDLFKFPEGFTWPKFNGIRRGEALSGLHPDPKVFIWPEVAHLDLCLGNVDGPAGIVYGNALAKQDYGFNNLMAVVNPNLATKPSTVIVTKVKTDSRDRANQMFGACQSAIADAVTDALEYGFFPLDSLEDLVCTVGVFVDPNAGAEKLSTGKTAFTSDGKLAMLSGEPLADSNHRLYCLNYVSMVAALWMAITGGRSPASIVEQKKKNPHVLRGFEPKNAA